MALRVLVVDDSRVARSAVARAFQKAGCEVAGLAADGDEAVEMYKKLRPDLVTMDLVMPKMGGLEALKAIKESHADAVVVIVSSVATRTQVMDCLKAGADHYLVKPFSQEKIGEVLTSCFGGKIPRGDKNASDVVR